MVVDAGVFDWGNGRYPVVADPSPAYHGLAFYETFGMHGLLMKLRAESLRDLGSVEQCQLQALAVAPLDAGTPPKAKRLQTGNMPTGIVMSSDGGLGALSSPQSVT